MKELKLRRYAFRQDCYFLTSREKDIIQHRFLEDGRTTLADIGESYGVTKERIRQIESRALTKLKSALGEQHGEDALIDA